MASNDEKSDFENERATVGVRWNLPNDKQTDASLGENTCKWQKVVKDIFESNFSIKLFFFDQQLREFAILESMFLEVGTG